MIMINTQYFIYLKYLNEMMFLVIDLTNLRYLNPIMLFQGIKYFKTLIIYEDTLCLDDHAHAHRQILQLSTQKKYFQIISCTLYLETNLIFMEYKLLNQSLINGKQQLQSIFFIFFIDLTLQTVFLNFFFHIKQFQDQYYFVIQNLKKKKYNGCKIQI
ncbi:hypothetical protein RFI_36039, partial [Reticulomyxa filosa]